MQHSESRNLWKSFERAASITLDNGRPRQEPDLTSPASKELPSVTRSFGIAILLILSALRVGSAAELNNVLLDFTAKWCGPCQQMSSTVSKLERAGLPIRKVDVDQEPELASRFGVQSIPCFVLIANGKEIDRISGITDEKHLRGMLSRLPAVSNPTVSANDGGRRTGSMSGANGGGNVTGTETVGLGQPVVIGSLGVMNGQRPKIGLPPLLGGKSRAKSDQLDDPSVNDRAIARGQNPDDGQPRGLSKGDPNANGPIDPILGSVRLKVEDATGINFGSGTIIDSRPGRAVILTCGHLFRKGGTNAKVDVDVFGPHANSQPESFPGNVLHYDLDADVGVITINAPQKLAVVRLAAAREPVVKDRLVSIGCGGGNVPSREDVVLTALNKYAGPDNIECTGMPQQGRSGGGLFRGNEQVGICIAADPKEKRGIYAGMKPIATLLDKVGLGHLAPVALASEGALAKNGMPDRATSDGVQASIASATATALAADDITQFLKGELGIEDTAGAVGLPQDYEGAEIVCIVRPKTPGAPSRVVIVNQASGRFVGDLLQESFGSNERATARREPITPARLPRPNALIDAFGPHGAGIQVARNSVERTASNQRLAASQNWWDDEPTGSAIANSTSGTHQSAADHAMNNRPVETSFEPQPYRRKRD